MLSDKGQCIYHLFPLLDSTWSLTAVSKHPVTSWPHAVNYGSDSIPAIYGIGLMLLFAGNGRKRLVNCRFMETKKLYSGILRYSERFTSYYTRVQSSHQVVQNIVYSIEALQFQ